MRGDWGKKNFRFTPVLLARRHEGREVAVESQERNMTYIIAMPELEHPSEAEMHQKFHAILNDLARASSKQAERSCAALHSPKHAARSIYEQNKNEENTGTEAREMGNEITNGLRFLSKYFFLIF